MPLRPQNLAEIAARVPVPTYDRSAVVPGIVHVGVGGFHRAHQAMYADALMNDGGPLDWGILGIGLLPGDARMRDVLDEQDGLYTLVLKGSDGSRTPRVIGSIVGYLFAPDDPDAVIEAMAAPTTRIVSLTVTEGGYNLDHVTGEFDTTTPAVIADATGGAVPTTVFGLVTEALARRRERGIPPFTVSSCDNLQGNGTLARKVFVGFAGMRDPDLADWVAEHVSFPNAMVDRITPATTDDDRHEVTELTGIDDGWPVVCEPFTQWVVEDDFPFGRPDWERVGAQLVDDVEPYELMKLRLLNASHQAIAYPGYLAGYRLVHEAARDPLFAGFLRAYMDSEATPTLAPVPGVDLDEYKATLIERFSNAAVRDTIPRLAAESSDRIPKWVLPVIREQLAAGRPVDRAATIVAAWARYAEGVDEEGEPIDIVDQLADRIRANAAGQRDDPLAFVRDRRLFGELVDDEGFTGPYRWALDRLHTRGARATLAELAQR